MTSSQHVYEVCPRKDHRGVDLISDALPFGRLWYDGPNAASNAIGYASQYSRSHDAMIRVYDEAGNQQQHKKLFNATIRSKLRPANPRRNANSPKLAQLFAR